MGGLDVGKSKRSLSPFVFNCSVYLLASSMSFMGVLEIWEQVRFHFCFRSQWRKARKASFIPLANIRPHCLEEHLKSTFNSVVLN